MRSRLKQIGMAAVIAALTVTGLSVASGGGGDNKKPSSSSSAGPAFAVSSNANTNGDRKFERGRHLRFDFPADADVRAVLKDIHAAVAKQAPDIAGPVIEKAEKDGKITAAQADQLRQAAQDLADGKRPDIRGLLGDSDVRDVINDAFAAAHDKVPGIAEPIIAKAVTDKKITEAQADKIREMVRHGMPPIAPPGPGLHGPGGHAFGPPPAFADKDVQAVLEDVHKAVAKQAADIVGPVIDKAEKDGKITGAQADKLRDATAGLIGGKPHGGPPRLLELRDQDVREVLHDAFEAIEAKTAGIANPIIDKAVEDGKITQKQADQIKSMRRGFKGGPGHHHGLGPGGPPPGAFGPGGPGPDQGPPPDFDRPAAPSAPSAPQSSRS